jgi:hypothetical protein
MSLAYWPQGRAREAIPYVAAGLALAATIAASDLLWRAGIQRGAGALFWLLIIWTALSYGRGPGISVALVGGVLFDLLFVPELMRVDWDGLTFHVVLWSMVAAAYFLGAPRGSRGLAVQPLRFWDEPDTGDFAADCERGERRADEYHRVLTARREGFVMGLMASDMIHRGVYGAAEIGFFHRISELLMGRGAVVRRVPHHNPQNNDAPLGVIEPDDEVPRTRTVGD